MPESVSRKITKRHKTFSVETATFYLSGGTTTIEYAVINGLFRLAAINTCCYRTSRNARKAVRRAIRILEAMIVAEHKSSRHIDHAVIYGTTWKIVADSTAK